MPGVKKEDLNVELHDGLLTLSGTRSARKTEKTDKWHSTERTFGQFSRTFTVPENVSEADVQAHLENGELVVVVNKPAVQAPKKYKVAIK